MQQCPGGSAGSDEALKQHNRIHIAQLPVLEGSGQVADELKTVLLPAEETCGVGADHQVELHRAEPQPPRPP